MNFDAYPSQLIPVTSDDGATVVGYEYPRLGFIGKAVVDALGFNVSDLKAVAADRAAQAASMRPSGG